MSKQAPEDHSTATRPCQKGVWGSFWSGSRGDREGVRGLRLGAASHAVGSPWPGPNGVGGGARGQVTYFATLPLCHSVRMPYVRVPGGAEAGGGRRALGRLPRTRGADVGHSRTALKRLLRTRGADVGHSRRALKRLLRTCGATLPLSHSPTIPACPMPWALSRPLSSLVRGRVREARVQAHRLREPGNTAGRNAPRRSAAGSPADLSLCFSRVCLWPASVVQCRHPRW